MNALDVSLQENGESTAVNIVFIVRKRYEDGLTFPAEREEAPGTFYIAVVQGGLRQKIREHIEGILSPQTLRLCNVSTFYVGIL